MPKHTFIHGKITFVQVNCRVLHDLFEFWVLIPQVMIG